MKHLWITVSSWGLYYPLPVSWLYFSAFFDIYSVTFADEPAGSMMSWWGKTQFTEMHWFSAGKDLDLGRKEREVEKRTRSPLFKTKYPKALLTCVEVAAKMEVLSAGSFSPFHRPRRSGVSCKRNPSLPILKSRYEFSLAFSRALFWLISINSPEAIPYTNRQLGLGIYFADFVIAS